MAKTAALPPAVLEYIEKETKVNQSAIRIVIASLINAIALEVEKGKEVTINPLGKFVLRTHKAKELSKEGVASGHTAIPESKVLRFVPCRRMKQHLNQKQGERENGKERKRI